VAETVTPTSATVRVSEELDDEAVLEAIERRVAESIKRLRESAVALEYALIDAPSGTRRVATGVVVNERGDVLSIRIDPPSSAVPIVAQDAAGGRHPARWIAADAETGLTLLRIDAKVVRPVRVASRAPRLGSQVLLIGNPFGLGHSASRGQIAGLDRRVDVGPRPLGGLIQIDAALHPGDSGALVANLRGEWLGLIRSGLKIPGAGRTFDHDLGFAISARDALWIAAQLDTPRHRVDRSYLGVRLDLTGHHDPGASGAVLKDVVADTPAARGGLKAGDRIVAFDDYTITSPGDLTDRLDRTLGNTRVSIEFVRGTHRERRTIRTASRPITKSAPPSASAKEGEDDTPSPTPGQLLERLDALERRLRALEKKPQDKAPDDLSP
jgi:S1-C subfamily serine protease